MDTPESPSTAVTLRRFLLSVALAYAFGGFSFYATVVVPTGTELLDATSQGFVTQTVTHTLNAASAVTIILLLWETISGRRERRRRAHQYLTMLTAGLTLSCVTLVLLHPMLDALLDENQFSIAQPDRFYRLHQAYLWTSTVQWLLTICVFWRLSIDWQYPATDATERIAADDGPH